jgi:hypothetical protein
MVFACSMQRNKENPYIVWRIINIWTHYINIWTRYINIWTHYINIWKHYIKQREIGYNAITQYDSFDV